MIRLIPIFLVILICKVNILYYQQELTYRIKKTKFLMIQNNFKNLFQASSFKINKIYKISNIEIIFSINVNHKLDILVLVLKTLLMVKINFYVLVSMNVMIKFIVL